MTVAVIFEVINTSLLERDNLKGLARFTKKGQLQSRINRKKEKIEILKIGLSSIAKRYGYQNVQDFYRIYHKAEDAYAAYQKEAVKWKKATEKTAGNGQEQVLGNC